jgi:predicted esterase
MDTKQQLAMHWIFSAICGLACAAACGALSAAELTLRDGRVLKGDVAEIAGVAEDPNAVADVAQIILVDSGLTRTFVPQRHVEKVNPGDTGEIPQRFRVEQQIPSGGARINAVGPITRITPFSEYGRRTLSMNAGGGNVDVIQGITDITPTWTKVMAVRKYIWDQRIATNSIPREMLGKVLSHAIDRGNVDDRLKIVRLYLQSDRYEDARKELAEIIADFPDSKDRFETTERRLAQLAAQRLLAEIKLRRIAGQHRFAFNLLKDFPADDVAGEILQEVSDLLGEYKDLQSRAQALLDQFDKHQAALTDENLKKRFEPLLKQIRGELSINTIDRLSSYQQLGGAAELSADQKLSLAVSGWLLGKDGATEDVGVAQSLYDLRELMHDYFNSATKLDRDAHLKNILALESATPENIAKLLAHMKPPVDTPTPETRGLYQLSVPGLGNEAPTTYYVQLPEEYDPYRRYPAVVTLHGAGTSPRHQLDWWFGARDPEGRFIGQGARHGYIVIAPHWAREHQQEYGYTAAEHAAVVSSLRDACKRFSIDTDRVFLSGHSMGGDAAWDIGLAHPDLWAGVIPIVAVADKHIAHYWPNADYMPMYFVGGELDGDKMVRNSRDFDRYLNKAYDVTVVEYRGRGHEHFSDEILNLFDWMSRYKRNFFPFELETATMRPWDNFFFWLELDEFPAKGMVTAADWPPPRGVRAISTKATIGSNNSIRVTTGASRVSVWLSPELVDFTQPLRAQVNGGKLGSEPFVRPDITVMLEDARTRGDRQHPFWAKLESAPKGRAGAR